MYGLKVLCERLSEEHCHSRFVCRYECKES